MWLTGDRLHSVGRLARLRVPCRFLGCFFLTRQNRSGRSRSSRKPCRRAGSSRLAGPRAPGERQLRSFEGWQLLVDGDWRDPGDPSEFSGSASAVLGNGGEDFSGGSGCFRHRANSKKRRRRGVATCDGSRMQCLSAAGATFRTEPLRLPRVLAGRVSDRARRSILRSAAADVRAA